MRHKELFFALSLILFVANAAGRTNPMLRFTSLLNKVTKNLSDRRHGRLTGPSKSAPVKPEMSMQQSVTSASHPLYNVFSEMKTNLETLQLQAASELELDVRGSEYLDKIGEFYYQEFLNRCGQYTYHRQYVVLKDAIVEECTETCKELTNGFPAISYTGTISELQADIDNYIDQVPSNQAIAVRQNSGLAAWRNSVWYARSKWLLAQVLMLALNFGQYELHRRLSIRAAEKRLAEVPEFPLL